MLWHISNPWGPQRQKIKTLIESYVFECYDRSGSQTSKVGLFGPGQTDGKPMQCVVGGWRYKTALDVPRAKKEAPLSCTLYWKTLQ